MLDPIARCGSCRGYKGTAPGRHVLPPVAQALPGIMKRCTSIFGTLYMLLAVCLPAVWAQDGLHGVLSRPGFTAQALLGFGEQLAATDFDNDKQPDAAILLNAGLSNGQICFRIELHVTAGRNHSITFLSPESGLTISAFDVNRDGAPDIVIERKFTHERLRILLNDGHGGFHEVNSKDFSLPNPSAPQWGGWFAQSLPLSCIPPTRGLELPGPRCVATVELTRGTLRNSRTAVLRSSSSAQSPSAPRAPPSSFVL